FRRVQVFAHAREVPCLTVLADHCPEMPVIVLLLRLGPADPGEIAFGDRQVAVATLRSRGPRFAGRLRRGRRIGGDRRTGEREAEQQKQSFQGTPPGVEQWSVTAGSGAATGLVDGHESRSTP